MDSLLNVGGFGDTVSSSFFFIHKEMMRLCQVHQPQHRSEFISPEVFFFSDNAYCTIATYSKHHIPTSSSFILYSDQNDLEQIRNFANTIVAKGF